VIVSFASWVGQGCALEHSVAIGDISRYCVPTIRVVDIDFVDKTTFPDIRPTRVSDLWSVVHVEALNACTTLDGLGLFVLPLVPNERDADGVIEGPPHQTLVYAGRVPEKMRQQKTANGRYSLIRRTDAFRLDGVAAGEQRKIADRN